MLDTLDADQGIGNFSHFRSLAFHDQDFKTVFVIEMHMHACHDVPLKVVLDVSELPGEIPNMMVVDERDRRNRFTVRIAAPFLTHELIADEIAKCFRTRGIFPTPDDPIEVIQKMMVQ